MKGTIYKYGKKFTRDQRDFSVIGFLIIIKGFLQKIL